jgi:hypothetical protein
VAAMRMDGLLTDAAQGPAPASRYHRCSAAPHISLPNRNAGCRHSPRCLDMPLECSHAQAAKDKVIFGRPHPECCS